MNIIKSVLALALLCFFTMQASAQAGARKAQLDSMLTELNLDANQKTQLKGIRDKYKTDLKSARQNKDRNAMRTQMQAMNQEIGQILNEEQKRKWQAFVESKKNTRGQRRG
jgi:uncharacterized protein (DUF3084 family)